MKNLKKYGAAAAAGLVAATLLSGCGDTKEAPASEGSTKSGLTQYKPPKVDTKGLLSKAKDGTFEGKSAANGEGEYSIISITVKSACRLPFAGQGRLRFPLISGNKLTKVTAPPDNIK